MKYFIFTPWAKTGGPEALHQVSHGINFCGEQSYIVYYDDQYNIIHQNEIYPEYGEYNLKNANIENIQEIDVKENVFIFPEVFSVDRIKSVKNAKIIFWRLSIFTHNQHLDNPTFKNVYQGCQSNISYQILKNSNLFDMNKIFMLSDFTNQKYLKTEDEIENERKNIVLYSPRKGISHTLKIIEILKQNENIEFIPITNLTREQLSDIISVSKVYIDFGDHPGKDRIPRECAVGGCVVIVGTQNSGGNDIDVPIEQKFEYNIEDDIYDYHEIASFIGDAIDNYSYFFECQKNYRDIIRKEKQTFFDEIKYMIELQKGKLDMSNTPQIKQYFDKKTVEDIKDCLILENQILLDLGLNNELLGEQPTEFSNYYGKGLGLRIWQYPNQFSKYLILISEYAKKINSYLEIGCRHGGTFILSSEYITKLNPKFNKSVAVDIIDASPILNEYIEFNSLAEFKKTNSTSDEFKIYIQENFFDVVFVDGDHSYEGVKLDAELTKDKCNIQVFHDISSDACGGVVEYWNEIKDLYKKTHNFHEFTDQYDSVSGSYLGIGVAIRKKWINEV